MTQDQQPRNRWKIDLLVGTLAALALIDLLIIIILGYLLNWKWTGLETKSAWDWLELLIIPVLLGAGAIWFNNQTRKSEQELAHRARENDQELARRERENDREIAEDRAREEALQRYLDTMQKLVLNENLQESKREDAVRVMARARTLTVLRSLDSERKGQLLRFLYEADLIGKAVKDSEKGQVIGAIAVIVQTTDLTSANLPSDKTWTIIDLRTADLTSTNLTNATLPGIYLSYTNLMDANLSGATLPAATLTGANLTGANLGGADLSGADLRDARGWTNAQLAQARSLIGAIMPDGTVMTEEAWEEFKRRYRQ